MTSQRKKTNKVNELEHFLQEIEKFLGYVYLQRKGGLTRKQATEAYELRNTLVEDTGRFKGLITELTGRDKVILERKRKGLPTEERPVDMWALALDIHYDSLTSKAVWRCIDVTRMAVGKLKSDIEQGVRDEQGNLLQEPVRNTQQMEQETMLSETSSRANWKTIESEFGITKTGFGRKTRFITDPFKKTIIFRDVEHAFILASAGFSKPAVILAGSVIEELLRLYLQYKQIKPIKNDFDGYIQTCEQNKLLEVGISRLSDSTRRFRNLVHLSKEKTKKDSTSKSKAKGAVASIFTIADDF